MTFSFDMQTVDPLLQPWTWSAVVRSTVSTFGVQETGPQGTNVGQIDRVSGSDSAIELINVLYMALLNFQSWVLSSLCE